MSGNIEPQAPERSVESLYACAFSALSQHRYADAACLLRLMLHLAPKDERAWLGLGLCHERLGQLELASQLYASGVLAAGPSGRCALACARVLREQGRDDESEQLFEHAVSAFESSGDAALMSLAQREMEATR